MPTNTSELISDGQRFNGAKTRGGYDINTYDDGFGPLYISRNSIGIYGIVRAQTWEDAYSICEDEFFSEANETVEELVKEYGFKREHVKIIHPAILKDMPVTYADGSVQRFDIDFSVEREATQADYELVGVRIGDRATMGRLLPEQFVRWETRETPDPEAWYENELFCEAYGFRPNGPNARDKRNHGIYQKDLNGDSLDRLTREMVEDLGITLDITSEDEDEAL